MSNWFEWINKNYLPGLNRKGIAAVRTAKTANNGRTNDGAATSPYT